MSTHPQVLELATASGLLDPTLKKLTVDAIVNRWTDDDPRWELPPVTAESPLARMLRVLRIREGEGSRLADAAREGDIPAARWLLA